MGKVLGLLFFVCGIGAVYFWGVRPLTTGSAAAPSTPIVITARVGATPVVFNVDQRAVASTVSAFLTGWRNGQYGPMYDLLSQSAQRRVSRASFIARYRGVMAEATERSVTASLGAIHIVAPEATGNVPHKKAEIEMQFVKCVENCELLQTKR